MWGAIIGDIVGSRFEHENLYSEFFELFDPSCAFTDDTVMTLATLMCLQTYKKEELNDGNIELMYRKVGITYSDRKFGGMFYQWLMDFNQKSYGSFGNGALMRISPVAKWAIDNNWSKEEMINIANRFTNITHNSPEALFAVKIYLTILFDLMMELSGKESIEEREQIAEEIVKRNIKGTIFENVKKTRDLKMKNLESLNLSCDFTMESVLAAFFENIKNKPKNSYVYKFADGIKKMVAMGGDCDTTAAILGPILEVIYGIPPAFKVSAYRIAFKKFDEPLIDALNKFYGEDIRSDVMFINTNYQDYFGENE